MMNVGKKKCELLKNIRKEIALRYGISYTSEECSYEGECKGICPKCEQEVKYLETELNKKGVLDKSLFLQIFDEKLDSDTSTIKGGEIEDYEHAVLMGDVVYSGTNEEDSNPTEENESEFAVWKKIRELRKNILSKFSEKQGCIENDIEESDD
ncbi:MAG: hypothetical protein IJY54_07275 [Paludibacteraceae bacterium]|nr:hypothetical protein [Paludibacteraceae bacterium]MBQ9101158.1 hypothetical protein [Paludibacteraceae bacterium]